MDLICAAPTQSRHTEKVIAFLQSEGLSFESDVEYTATMLDDSGNIAATGSIAGNIFKCFAVSEQFRGEGLTATIATELFKYAHERNIPNLFLFTKPENEVLFAPVGFTVIAQAQKAILMESSKGAVERFSASLPRVKGQSIGAVVANCNPFTLGHRHLIEYAAAHCDWLYLFILSQQGSEFSPETRFELAKQGTAHIPNITVCQTGNYMVSAATFPSYFLKKSDDTAVVQASLDLDLFGKYFAKPLNINKRFVGTEPLSPVTAVYNTQMHRILPEYGVQVVEIPRIESGGQPISASRVRDLLQKNETEQLKQLLPKTTLEYLIRKQEN